MARRNLNVVVRYLQRLTGSANASGAGDAELLERYVHQHDEAAFELLLWRHGALVFNVCRRLLPREQDAEDAFQATFLAFVRKADSIHRRGSVASWLYKVAYRVALDVRERARKTAARETAGGDVQAIQRASDPLGSDVRPLLDAEVNRLPERLRRPIVLCYLEGKTNEEAARELGCRLGTIYSRLARGREILRRRLLRRGVTLSVAALTARTVEAAPATLLIRTTVRAALSFAERSAAVSPRVASLAEGVLRSMFVTKLKIAAVMLFVATLLTAGGVLSHGLTATPQAEAKTDEPPAKPKGDDKKDAKLVAVKVAKAKKGGSPLLVTYSAEAIASQQQQVVPLVSGTVKEVLVDIGDRVKKGQTLIILDAPLLVKEVEEAAASLELAQAQLKEAEATVEAEEALFRRGVKENPVKSRASLNAAKARVRLAQATLDKARIQESFTQLKAACDGFVTRRTIDPGNFVQPSDSRLLRPLLTVQRLDSVRIVVQVAGDYAPLVKRGMPVEVWRLDVHEGNHTISRFQPSLDAGNRTMTVEIDVPNADHRILAGMTVTVAIPLLQTSPENLIVPRRCVVFRGNVPSVYVVRNGKAYPKRVEVVSEDVQNAEIAKGLTLSDLLIINNQLDLSEGTPVTIEKAP